MKTRTIAALVVSSLVSSATARADATSLQRCLEKPTSDCLIAEVRERRRIEPTGMDAYHLEMEAKELGLPVELSPGHVGIAKTLIKLNRTCEARTELAAVERYLRRDLRPDIKAVTAVELIGALVDVGQLDQATMVVERHKNNSITLFGGDFARLKLSDALIKDGKFDSAQQVMKGSTFAKDDTAARDHVLRTRAILAAGADDQVQADKHLAAITDDKTREWAKWPMLNIAASRYAKQGKIEDALKLVAGQAMSATDKPRSLVALVRAAHRGGHTDAARNLRNEARALIISAPSSLASMTLLEIGALEAESGDAEAATKTFADVFQLIAPGKGTSVEQDQKDKELLRLIKAQADAGQMQAAERTARSIKFDEHDPKAREILIEAFTKAGKIDQAKFLVGNGAGRPDEMLLALAANLPATAAAESSGRRWLLDKTGICLP
jgi:hypothetical protein